MPANTRPNKLAEEIFKKVMGDHKNVSKKISIKNTPLVDSSINKAQGEYEEQRPKIEENF